MALPGLSFEIVRSSGPLLGIRADRTALIALTERGPEETPTLVHSHDQFGEVFGCPVDGMLGPLAAKDYYANGGEELLVTRFLPLEAAAATGTLSVVGASAPGVVIQVRARDRGAFGNRIEVSAMLSVRKRGKGEADSATSVKFAGVLDPVFLTSDEKLPARLLSQGVEHWTRLLTITGAVPGDQIATFATGSLTAGDPVVVELFEPVFTLRIREPARADVFVPGLDLRDLDAAEQLLAPTVVRLEWTETTFTELPDPDVRIRLAGGDDGMDATNSAAELRRSFERALAALELSELPDIVIAPDLWSRTFRSKGVVRLAFGAATAVDLADQLVLSAARTQDRVVLVDPPLGGPDELRPFGVGELEAWRATREASLGAARDFAATYTPWSRIVAGPVFKGDDTLLVPPSAQVAGQMALTSRTRGPWIATGNVALENAVALDQTLSEPAQERLQDVGINPLRMSLPRGATIQGVRSLSWPDRKPWRFLSTRRLFNFLRRALRPIGLSYVFEPNAPQTWIQLRRDIERLLRDLFANGALAGSRPQDAFFVKVDDALNPEPARENGVLTAQIGVAPAFPLEFLHVRLIVAGGIATVAEEPITP